MEARCKRRQVTAGPKAWRPSSLTTTRCGDLSWPLSRVRVGPSYPCVHHLKGGLDLLTLTFPGRNFFFFLAVPLGMQDLSPRPGIKHTIPAVEAQSLNHWTTRHTIIDSSISILLLFKFESSDIMNAIFSFLPLLTGSDHNPVLSVLSVLSLPFTGLSFSDTILVQLSITLTLKFCRNTF